MIDEQGTRLLFGYYTIDLTKSNRSPIIVICDKCGNRRKITYSTYNSTKYPDLCKSCSSTGKYNHRYGKPGAMRGKHHTEESKRKISECQIGKKNSFYKHQHTKKVHMEMSKRNTKENNPNYGVKATREKLIKMSASAQGIPICEWTHFSSKSDYPNEFNETLRIQVRNMYNNRCFTCNNTSDIALSVHHIDRNKLNNSVQNLIPLCTTCHGKAHTLRYQSIYTYIKLYEKLEDSDET